MPVHCEEPTCRRIFSGSRSLTSHHQHSRKCREWYKRTYIDNSSESDSGFDRQGQESSVVDNRLTASDSESSESRLTNQLSSVLQQIRAKKHAVNHGGDPVPDAPVPDAPVPDASVPDAPSADGSESEHGPPDTPMPDDDVAPGARYIDDHPTAAADKGKGKNILEHISLSYFVEQRRTNVYYPFRNKDDWEVAAFLSNSSLSMAEIDTLLSLSFVRAFLLLSLNNKRQVKELSSDDAPRPPLVQVSEAAP